MRLFRLSISDSARPCCLGLRGRYGLRLRRAILRFLRYTIGLKIMDAIEIRPAKRLRGDTQVPGDKSIGHRAALIGAIAEGTTVAENFPMSADCQSTLRCLERLGVSIERDPPARVRIHGRGLRGLEAPTKDLDAGNAGTLVRLLSGILAGQGFSSTLVGDESLSRRPMQRIVQPLEQLGARIETTDGHLPMTITGGAIRAIDYRLPVASAQVKSAVLLAGLLAEGTTTVHEPIRTRDHTEIALKASGAAIEAFDVGNLERRIEIEGGHPLAARSLRVPGDPSSAAFLIAAALLVPESELRLSGVGINPSRSDYLSLLADLGADLQIEARRLEDGEAVAEIVVRTAPLEPIAITAGTAAGLIDELPILAILGVCGVGRVSIRGAEELRHKETDRIRALAANLEAIGVRVTEFDDGLDAECDLPVEGGTVRSFGDHRIAMAFAVAGLVSRRGVRVQNAGCVDISFPGFFELLEGLVQR
jgi:3-phosphoshikimate 1-carboxyvinyltransferase